MNHLKKPILTAILALAFSVAGAKVYNMAELGVDATGKVKCTGLINETIARASAEGGGTLFFPAGEYLTGAIRMRSDITIEVESGATIGFSDDFEDYLPFVRMRWEGVFMNSLCPLIYAEGAENITIRGRGRLDGRGHKWWAESRRIIDEIRRDGKTSYTNELQSMWLEANAGISVEPYYEATLERKFFRPPFIQFLECSNILIEGVTIENSPFWTVNPEGCDNIVISGVTILNPWENPKGHNTDGINPSSCRDVRISNCLISVGDDCITIKSGRDKGGRAYGRPCEVITITNCVMHTGHGGVVIGSEMSGGVRKVAISNCVFDGTDAGIRLKSSRGRGGTVEDIRVDNIVMNNIRRNAFIFDLLYDRGTVVEPVTERTPIFRNIHLSNITGNNIEKIGYITGLEEMPVSGISFFNVVMKGREGFTCERGSGLVFDNVDLSAGQGPSLAFTDCRDILLNNIRAAEPLPEQAVVEITGTENILINNCFQISVADIFCSYSQTEITWGTNYFQNVREPVIVR